jgi:hypothetical protein
MPDIEIPSGSQSPRSQTRESVVFLALLAAFIAFPILCVVASVVATKRVGPWLGVIVAACGLVSWRRFGPPPSPGFVSGILCIWGHLATLGVLLVCLALAVWRLIG